MFRLSPFFPQPNFEAPQDGGGGGAAQPWFHGREGMDQETIGYFMTRGWDKDVTVAAIEASKAHRAAEKFIGVPTSELVRIPNEANDPKWADVHTRMGKPADAKDYDLSNVKGAGDQPLSDAFQDAIRKVAHSLNLPKDRAPILAKAIADMASSDNTTAAAERSAKLANERAELDRNWGGNKEANLFIARQAAAKLGATPEEINALETVVGYAKVMEMLRNIGVRMGEDRFVRNEMRPGGGVLSREEAAARREELMHDQDWVKRYIGGDATAGREMNDLLKIISAPR